MSEQATQHVELPAPMGVDTATAPELVQPAKALELQNVRTRDGSLKRRAPFERVTREATIDGDVESRLGEVQALFPVIDAVACATDDSRVLIGVGPTVERWREVERNDVPVSTKRALHSRVGDVYKNVNLAIAGDYLCVTWSQVPAAFLGDPVPLLGGNGYAMIIRISTWTVLSTQIVAQRVAISIESPLPDYAVNPGLVPVSDGTNFALLWHPITSGAEPEVLYGRSINPATDSEWGSAVVVADDASPFLDDDYGAPFDVCAFGTAVYLAYRALEDDPEATPGLKVRRLTITGGTVATAASETYGGDPRIIAISAETNRLLVAYGEADAIRYQAITRSTLAAFADDTISTPLDAAPNQLTCLAYTLTDAEGASVERGFVSWSWFRSEDADWDQERYSATTVTARVDLTTPATDPVVDDPVLGVSLCHRPFRRTTATPINRPPIFVGLRRNQETEDTYYTYLESADVQDTASLARSDYAVCTPVARYSAGTAAHPAISPTPTEDSRFESSLSAAVPYGDAFLWVGVEQVQESRGHNQDIADAEETAFPRETLTLYTCDFARDRCWQAIELNGQTLIAGSIPRHVSPEALDIDSDAPRRGLDGIVPLHSPPVPTLDEQPGGSLDEAGTYEYVLVYEYTDLVGKLHRGAPSLPAAITLVTENTIRITAAPYQAPVPGYREHALQLYRANNGDPERIFYHRATLQADGDTLDDDVANAEIETNEILYTVSGELPNFPPPPCLALFPWKGRFVALDSETGRLWPSKTLIVGEWPGFHEGLSVSTDVHTELPVFASPEGDSILVWWRDAIGVVYGEPATDTGQPGTMTLPQLLPQRFGLKYVRSLVRTAAGHLFLSQRGFQLLTGGQCTYIGRDVQSYEGWECVGAYLPEEPADTHEVRFEMRDDDGTCVALLFDYVRQVWSVDTRARSVSAAAVVHGDVYVATEPSGTDAPWTKTGDEWGADSSGVWRENVGSESANDPPGRFRTLLKSAWYKLAGLIGVQRAKTLWLLGDFSVDAADAAIADIAMRHDFDDAATHQVGLAQSGRGPRVLEAPFTQHECSAFQVEIGDFQTLIGMRVEVEPEKGANRRNARIAGGG